MADATPADFPMTGDGWEAVFETNNRARKGWLETLSIQTAGRFQWWRNVVIKNQHGGTVETGLPDFGVLFEGRTHWIECKHESTASAMQVGQLVAPIAPDGRRQGTAPGVKPEQARRMDGFLLSGPTVHCWIAARLEVNAATLRRAAQMPLVGPGGDIPPVIMRLVPWPLWRRWMADAEAQRAARAVWDRGLAAGAKVSDKPPEIGASIPAATLAEMGFPCRNAGELMAALRSV